MDKFLEQLNESQREAVIYSEGPSLVIAGAGSGKTRVLTYKIAYLLKNGVAPYNILALTFTNKAAKEMKERMAPIVGEDVVRQLWMGTFHSIFSRILRRESDKIGFKSDFTIYDSADSKNLIKTIIKEMALDDKLYKPGAVLSRISRAKNALITAQAYACDKELIEEDMRSKRIAIRDIYSAYCGRCRRAGAMDFDDLLLYTQLLFEQFPEVIGRYRHQFSYILVDEYQDTNTVQHEIVGQLAADHHRVCVVGDDAQSIYSFRGADIDNILNFKKTYPESKLFKLEQNYRSTQTIVNAANSLIYKNNSQIKKAVYSKKHEGDKIRVLCAYSDYEEGYAVAGAIADLRKQGQENFSDFAILYRTNAQSRIFEESLRKKNIPYKIYGGLSFYQRREVRDVIAYFRLMANPSDEEAFKRIINYPTRGIGATTLSKILHSATDNEVSLWDVLSEPTTYNLPINAGTAKKIENFRQTMLAFMQSSKELNAHEMGSLVIKEIGLVAELYQDKSPEGMSRIQNIEELVNSLYDFVQSRQEEGIEEIFIADFLAEISLLTDQDKDKGDQSEKLTMMTVHAAKGLEFKHVFVVGLEEELFPSAMSRNTEKEIEEERRLFYVALTRAEETCTLSYAKSRFHNGQSKMQAPSRFINDIDHSFLKLPSDMKVSIRTYKEPSPVQEINTTSFTKLSSAVSKSVVSHQSLNGLSVGNTIRHERFGLGKIIGIEGDSENAKASVEFESFGKKQLLLKFAKFEIIA